MPWNTDQKINQVVAIQNDATLLEVILRKFRGERWNRTALLEVRGISELENQILSLEMGGQKLQLPHGIEVYICKGSDCEDAVKLTYSAPKEFVFMKYYENVH